MRKVPGPREVADPETLRVLAHPLRQRIMRHLGQGPANSTTLARALGESTGATSYHLRQLARHGFVAEIPERSHGRQRWWRLVGMDLRFPRRSQQTAETRGLMDEMNRLAFAADLEDFAWFQLHRDEMGEWADALPYSRGEIQVTTAELLEFFEEYLRLLERYQRPDEDKPPGTRTVLTRFVAFPAPDPSRSSEPGEQSASDQPAEPPDADPK